jgi:hypothetical protein
MAKMIPLDPAPSTSLPVNGWRLVATEAGRYGDGLRATIQSHNGTLQGCYQLRLAHPKQWTGCIEDVAQHSACDAGAVGAAIRELIMAIEGMLRPRSRSSRDADAAPVSARPQIQVNGRFDREIIADAVDVLEGTNDPPTLFMRGSEFVRMVPGELQAVPFDVPRLRGLIDELADCVMIKASEYGEETLPSRLPFTVCQDFLVKPLAHAFPLLSGIRTAPVFLPDGRLLATDGYDRASGYLLRLGDLHGVNDHMTVTEALDWLQNELLADFPFAGQYSRAHTLALLLDPFVKPLIQSKTPVYAIDALTRGSGKGLLADVACLIATGGTAHVMALTGDSAEHEKKITALLMSGASWILMDNVTTLNSISLSAVLTATIWRGRILGASKMVSVPNDASWIATGNNIALSSEMARRVIPIRLEPQEERPEERDTFTHDPLLDWVREHRTDLVSACVSLIQAWIDAGRPAGKQTLGSFERWASVMGGFSPTLKLTASLRGERRCMPTPTMKQATGKRCASTGGRPMKATQLPRRMS